MGEYAEMSMERDLNDFIDGIDRYYGNIGETDYPFEPRIKTHSLPIKEFSEGESVLLRCNYDWGKTLNRVCIITKKTKKAILFKIDREIEEDIDREFMFWLPKSTLYMREKEEKVYWVKEWAKIKNVCRN